MKVATIIPSVYLDLIFDDQYHMCLAHLVKTVDRGVMEDPYTLFYGMQGRSKTSYVILDNGACEGQCNPIEEVVRKALYIQAKEIILPDVLGDAEATLDIGYESLRYVKGNFPLKLMAVPQGKTMEEWYDCAMAMLDWPIDCIGIPKSLIKIGGRDARLEMLMRLGNKVRGLDIHLLGCWQSPLEITLIAVAESNEQIPKIRGVDSAIPYIFTKADMLINEADRPTITFDFNETGVNRELLVKNIDMWRKVADVETIGGL